MTDIYTCGMYSYGSKSFRKIIDSRKLEGLERSFVLSENSAAVKKSGESDGGAGGEFFLQTFDKRFFIKTITEDEEAIFRNILSAYASHIQDNPDSFINRIIGLFTFEFDYSGSQIRLIVMENVFKNH